MPVLPRKHSVSGHAIQKHLNKVKTTIHLILRITLKASKSYNQKYVQEISSGFGETVQLFGPFAVLPREWVQYQHPHGGAWFL